jgi:hypothetical protein
MRAFRCRHHYHASLHGRRKRRWPCRFLPLRRKSPWYCAMPPITLSCLLAETNGFGSRKFKSEPILSGLDPGLQNMPHFMANVNGRDRIARSTWLALECISRGALSSCCEQRGVEKADARKFSRLEAVTRYTAEQQSTLRPRST